MVIQGAVQPISFMGCQLPVHNNFAESVLFDIVDVSCSQGRLLLDQPDAALADFSEASHPPEKKKTSLQALFTKTLQLLVSHVAVEADVTAVVGQSVANLDGNYTVQHRLITCCVT